MEGNKKQQFIDKITKKLSAFEEERIKRIWQLVIKQIIALVILYISFRGIFFFGEKHIYASVFCAFVTLLSAIAFFYNFSDDNKEFKTFLKQKCKKRILKEFNLTTLKKEKAFTDNILKKSNLFSLFTYQEVDDAMTGCCNNVDYTIAETKLIAKNKKNEFDVFKGVIISFKSNKKIATETLVTSKGDNNIRNYPPNSKAILIEVPLLILFPILLNLFWWISVSIKTTGINFSTFPFWQSISTLNLFNIIVPLVLFLGVGIPLYYQTKKMQNVKLEDINFEKKFNVYTKDQVEARYLLTPSFIVRLKNLETSFGTKGIKCSFFDDCIMFAISTKKDLFELGSLYKSLKSKKSVEEFYNQIKSIQDMVEHFKLNEKTGL